MIQCRLVDAAPQRPKLPESTPEWLIVLEEGIAAKAVNVPDQRVDRLAEGGTVPREEVAVPVVVGAAHVHGASLAAEATLQRLLGRLNDREQLGARLDIDDVFIEFFGELFSLTWSRQARWTVQGQNHPVGRLGSP